MKIIISLKGKCLTLGYIKKTKNSVIGWYMPDAMNINFINDRVQKRDFHITYPRDGNAHFSYKYFDPDTNQNFEKRVYYDEVVIKKFDSDMNFIGFEKQSRSDIDIDQHLAVKTHPLPLDEHFKVFLLPLAASVISDQFSKKIEQPCQQTGSEDIIFDVENLNGKILNVGFAIYTGNEDDFYWNISGIIDRKKLNVFGNIYIESYLLVTE